MNQAAASMAQDRLRRRAAQHIAANLMDAAQTTLESLVQLAPHDVSARIELAGVLLERGRMRAATEQLLQAVPLLPNNAPLIARLAWSLASNGEILAARACVQHLERAPEPPPAVLAEQAQLRWMLGDIPAARERMDRAVAAGIDSPGEYYLDAMLFQFAGRMQEAEQVLQVCLKRWPDHGDAAVVLANLRQQTAESNCLAFLRERLERMPRDSRDRRGQFVRAEFESAVFKVLDDLGRYDEAWPALARSNALMHAMSPYDAAAEVTLTDALVGLPTSDAPTPAGKLPPPRGEGPTPIFIVGMPRSGSTLLDHMLSAHSDIVSAGELSDFQRQLHWVADVAPAGTLDLMRVIERTAEIDFALLGARYLEQTQWRAHGRRYYIDKLPVNVRMVPYIRRALPQAIILHMVREPMDVCYSNLKVMFGRASPYCYDMHALAHYYGQYARLAEHWRTTLPQAMLNVSYAALVSDPRATLSRVLHYCGLELEEACLHPERNVAPVATPSSLQVRDPIHTRTLGQWRRYAAYLEPMREALAAQSALSSATKS